MDLWGFALFSLSSLFAVIDPLGCIPFFIGQTTGMGPEAKRRVLARALLVSLPLLMLFAYACSLVLHAFGITVDAFRIAGGILLFLTALDMLFERRTRRREDKATPEPQPDPSVFPLAIPLIAGPGAIASMILLVGQTGSLPGALAVIRNW